MKTLSAEERVEALLDIKRKFNGKDGAYSHRWNAMSMFREWAKLAGAFATVDAVDRFMEFMGGENDAPA